MKLSVLKIKDFEVNIKLFNGKFYCGLVLAVVSFIVFRMFGASMRANCVLPMAFCMMGLVDVQCNEKITCVLNTLWAMGSAVALFYLPQYLMTIGIGSISLKNIMLGILFTAAVLLFVYICTRNARVAVIVSFIILMAMAVANYYVVYFRGEELSPADFLAVGTAMNVASQYDFSVNIRVIYFFYLIVVCCFAGFCIPNLKGKFKKWNSILLIGAELTLVVVIGLGLKSVSTEYFMTSGTQLNGFFVNFLSKLKGAGIEQPESYDQEFLDALAKEYSTENVAKEEKPDIIVIMGEAFGDLRVMGDVRTDAEVMPFYDSLQENTIRGHALVSVYGGGTCNSEFEVLTGHSMSNLPLKTFPYQQYVKQDTWSMASYLKSLGYSTMATHPEQGINWMRDDAYPYLGFEETYFIDDYPKENLIRGHVSDQEMCEQIISWYNDEKGDSPLFYFGVTMQNHSPYTYDGEDFKSTVHLEGYSQEYPEVEQYLTLTQKSDQAIKSLVEYFETVENDVVIVFFGDHMPKLDSFYEELKGEPLDTLQDELNKRTVPFFVWANYDIEEQTIECTSLNYLSNFIYEAAGIALPEYNRFLEDVRQQIPAISAWGYYSTEQNAFVELSVAAGEEREMMEKYSCLQYNGLFDIDNRNETFFPLLEKSGTN